MVEEKIKNFTLIRKVANLFVLSEISKQHPKIVNAMSYVDNFPRMTKKDFEQLPPYLQNFLLNEWNNIFEVAEKEWIAIPYEEESKGQKIDCQLCGHKNIDLLYKIRNLENKKELIVGSECIKYFDSIKNNSKEDRKLYAKERREKQKVLKNISYAESISLGIDDKVKSFKRIHEDHSFIMSKDLEDEYKRITKLIKEDYDMELKKPKSKIDRRKIINVTSQITEFELEISKFKQKYKNDKWKITEAMANWCYCNEKVELIERLRTTEKIDLSTVDQIKEKNYLNFIVEEFRAFLKFNHFKLIKNNTNNFNVVSNYYERIIIIVDTIEFLKKYKKNLFTKKYQTVSMKDLLSVSKISKDNYDICADAICRKCRQDYKYKCQDANINEIAFISGNRILALDYAKFIDNFKNHIFKKEMDSKTNNKVIKYIEEKSKEYSDKDYSAHLKILGIF